MGWISDTLAATVVPRRHRIAIAIVAGLVCGAVTAQKNHLFPFPRDFGQVWFAARMLLHGTNPYPLVGPHLAYDWPWPLLYPLPAGVIAIPFAPLPLPWASVAFMALVGAAFGWALSAHGYGPIFGLFSASVHYAAETAQWSPLFAAATVVPWLGMFFIAKPTIGAAMFVARPSWWPVLGAVVFGGIAFLVVPTWPRDWLDAVHRNNQAWLPHHPYQIPALLPGGFLVLLALTRWRRPEARMLVALACVPQTPLQYEAVPLLLIPRTFWQSALLVGLSYAQHQTLQLITPEHGTPQPEYMDMSGMLVVLFLYLPCTLMVLRRPNERPSRVAETFAIRSATRDQVAAIQQQRENPVPHRSITPSVRHR